MKIRLKTTVDKEFREIEIEQGTTLEELCRGIQEDLPYRVLLAAVDNKYTELGKTIDEPCSVELFDMRTQAANRVYQRSLSHIFLKAVDDVLGKVHVVIRNPICKGLWVRIHGCGEMTDQIAESLEKRMRELVDADLPFEPRSISREKCLAFLEVLKLEQSIELLKQTPHITKLKYYSLDGKNNYFYGPMVPSTGYVEFFEVRVLRGGLVLRFPSMANPDTIPEFIDEPKLYETFKLEKTWQSLLGIHYLTDLNEKVENGEVKELIMLAEALHEQRIVEIAKDIVEKEKRIILVAGPSSSGKTTFAKKLCVQLRVNGLKPVYMGTDDYFVEREDTPLGEDGQPDYESLEAIDIDLFNDNMNDLLAGKEVDLPEFDFITGHKTFGKRSLAIKENQPLVIEGIHALNEAMTPRISREDKYKIYISPLTQLSVDRYNRVATTDARMLRRMVRDYQFRGYSAQDTINNWPKVRRGEDKNIFPYCEEADAFFNSVLVYEMAVLKGHVEPILKAITPDEREYAEARRILKFLEYFKAWEDERYIPVDSVIREFIGGSVYSQDG